MASETIARSVAEKVKEAKPGTILFPAELLEFGSPDAIRQTFSRLEKNKTLLRLAKGIYVKPTDLLLLDFINHLYRGRIVRSCLFRIHQHHKFVLFKRYDNGVLIPI